MLILGGRLIALVPQSYALADSGINVDSPVALHRDTFLYVI